MYVKDSKGNLDFCREKFTPVSLEAQDLVRKIKLQANELMTILFREWHAAENPDVRRMFFNAMEGFENATMWAVKGLTSQHRPSNMPSQESSDKKR